MNWLVDEWGYGKAVGFDCLDKFSIKNGCM